MAPACFSATASSPESVSNAVAVVAASAGYTATHTAPASAPNPDQAHSGGWPALR